MMAHPRVEWSNRSGEMMAQQAMEWSNRSGDR